MPYDDRHSALLAVARGSKAVVDDPGEKVVRWRAAGRVQGVGFRYFVLLAARREGVRGDVRNLPDGSVEVRAQGEPAALARLRESVGRGPDGARVDRVEALEPGELGSPRDFEIRH